MTALVQGPPLPMTISMVDDDLYRKKRGCMRGSSVRQPDPFSEDVLLSPDAGPHAPESRLRSGTRSPVQLHCNRRDPP